MAVENRIVKVQKRNRALVRFDLDRIRHAIARAAASVGGFGRDHHPGFNDRVFQACGSDETIAEFVTESVVVCLNAEPRHLISNFPPTIEVIQDAVLHTLRSLGFQHTADAYAGYRWCRHWLREGAISPDQFVGNGYPSGAVQDAFLWNQRHGCDTVTGLNELTRRNALRPLIEASLARYEESVDLAAAEMVKRINRGDPIRLMWISGPSSSGKTTTTVKLTERLQRHGLRFLMLNLDDYFWPLVEHPTDWINDRNYETPEALDIQLLNSHLRALLDGETVEKPVFNFKEGHRCGTRPVRLEGDQILLLDCLHGLYPPITEDIPASSQFRVYIENMNTLLEGDGSTGTRVPLTDVRMLRRVLRDARHRNHSPLRTLLHWHYVRAGELFSIIPLRGLADVVVDGGFGFELAVLKPCLTQAGCTLPDAVDLEDYAGFLDARIRLQRVRSLLDSIEFLRPEQALDYDLVPGDALIREFVGGSTISIPHNQ